jgi:methylated-DNA-[protein]-cysteine S-methyltransferase
MTMQGPAARQFHTTCHSRFGYMRAVSDGRHLIRLDWDQERFAAPENPDDVSRETCRQLAAYLAGRRTFFDLPLRPEGTSEAGRFWLTAMARIPYGTVVSYTAFAALAGKPQAPRAAGTACSTNPIPIIYPCHRVVRRGGALGNYGGGSGLSPRHPDNLGRKQALIDLERGFA